MSKNNSRTQIWTIPVIIAVLTVFGLLSALMGTGIWYALSWITLCIPLGIMSWHVFRNAEKPSARA